MIVRIITYERSTLVNDEKHIGLDVHQATISVAVMDKCCDTCVTVERLHILRSGSWQEAAPRKFFPGQNPIGKRVNVGLLGVLAEIVGVAGHVKHFGLDSDANATIQSQFYFPMMQVPDKSRWRFEKLIENKTMIPPMLELLSATVQGRLNIRMSGGTGAGKTTLLNVLSGYIPETERVITIEDAAELQLNRNHVLRLETRPPNIEGKGAIRQRELVINSLRMRPDRIVVGEVRGEEAFDMLQAMNTGHEGSLTTVHANSQRDALSRIENMVSMANLSLPDRAIRRQIASAIHAVVQVSRLSDGTRKVMTVSEVMGMDSDTISMQDIFVFEQQGIDESGRVRGIFRSTGVRPQFAQRLAAAGCQLPPTLFQSRMEV